MYTVMRTVHGKQWHWRPEWPHLCVTKSRVCDATPLVHHSAALGTPARRTWSGMRGGLFQLAAGSGSANADDSQCRTSSGELFETTSCPDEVMMLSQLAAQETGQAVATLSLSAMCVGRRLSPDIPHLGTVRRCARRRQGSPLQCSPKTAVCHRENLHCRQLLGGLMLTCFSLNLSTAAACFAGGCLRARCQPWKFHSLSSCDSQTARIELSECWRTHNRLAAMHRGRQLSGNAEPAAGTNPEPVRRVLRAQAQSPRCDGCRGGGCRAGQQSNPDRLWLYQSCADADELLLRPQSGRWYVPKWLLRISESWQQTDSFPGWPRIRYPLRVRLCVPQNHLLLTSTVGS